MFPSRVSSAVLTAAFARSVLAAFAALPAVAFFTAAPLGAQTTYYPKKENGRVF